MKSFDVIVAGVGSMGAAACFHLARQGVRVLGLEQFEVGHQQGSHHGHSRMIRQSYYEHPDYVPLLRRAYALWDELEELEIGEERFFHRTGGLYMGPLDGSIVPGARRAAEEHGLPHELLDPDELARRYPVFRAPPDFHGFFEEEAGFLIPEWALAAHARQAERHGAVIQAGEGVASWAGMEGGVEVISSQGERYQAAHLILTGGAERSLYPSWLADQLVVTRQVLAWFELARHSPRHALGSMPCWFIESASPYGHYGFPTMSSGPSGLKVALHKPGTEERARSLSEFDRKEATETELEDLSKFVRAHVADVGERVLASSTCYYSNSRDSHFIVGPDLEQPGLVTVAAGFSGHGFKFASVMGEVLAELAMEGRTRLPVSFLSPQRLT